jgi:uncharacterized protein YidB (DUF937 family)
MSEGFPSMTALLGLLAVAGYQNRDKIGELLGSLQGGGQAAPAGAGAGGGWQGSPGGQGSAGGQGGLGGLGGLLGGLGGAGSAPSAGGFLGGGLNQLVDLFTKNGQGQTVQSWVGPGPNQQIAPPQLERAIGPDVLDTLSKQTGLSRDELLARLSRELPQAVDKYTPEGRLPPADRGPWS